MKIPRKLAETLLKYLENQSTQNSTGDSSSGRPFPDTLKTVFLAPSAWPLAGASPSAVVTGMAMAMAMAMAMGIGDGDGDG